MAANNPPLKKKKFYTKNFQGVAGGSDWLQQDAKNLDACCCVCCEIKFKNSDKSMLIAHMKTVIINKLFAVTKSAIKLVSFVVNETSTLNTKVARAELTIAAFLQSITHLSNRYITLYKKKID